MDLQQEKVIERQFLYPSKSNITIISIKLYIKDLKNVPAESSQNSNRLKLPSPFQQTAYPFTLSYFIVSASSFHRFFSLSFSLLLVQYSLSTRQTDRPQAMWLTESFEFVIQKAITINHSSFSSTKSSNPCP